MKKIFIILSITILTVTSLFSQDINLSDLESQFETMSEDLGSAVASSATNGLVWSDAYIGTFPHLGIGVFTGAQIIPVEAFSDLLSVVDPDAELPSQLTELGVPVPSFGIDARIGGFILPFDIGVKFALVNDLSVGDISFDYSLIGADIRYAIIKGNALLPKVSVGVGYSRLTTDIAIEGILDGDYTIFDGGTNDSTFILTNPDLVYGWEANVLEFKAQVSKSLLFITPYLGVNAAYATTIIGGGLQTSVVDGDGDTVTQNDIDTYASDSDIDVDGFESYTETTAWSFKITGGTSINLALIKLDIALNYGLLSKTYGGQVGVRLQL